MENLKPQPTPKAEWYEVVTQAQSIAGYQFNEDIQSYLVLTLDHFTKNQSLSNSIIAMDFLENNSGNSINNIKNLKLIGDECLILSGLFPNHAFEKNVSLDYFISIGQECYFLISKNRQKTPLNSLLFRSLSQNFIGLMDILHHIRLLKP